MRIEAYASPRGLAAMWGRRLVVEVAVVISGGSLVGVRSRVGHAGRRVQDPFPGRA